MTKKYGIIHLNNFMYMVDKEHKPLETDWYYDSKQLSIRFGTNNTVDGSYKWKILASNDPSLNLPLLPNIEEDTDKFNALYAEAAKANPNRGIVVEDFKAGYKAASAKKYTEEDMRNAHMTGSISALNWDGRTYNHADKAEEYVASLNSLPIAIKVKMEEENDFTNQGFKGIKMPFHPKVVNNIIQVKQWIYEKDI